MGVVGLDADSVSRTPPSVLSRAIQANRSERDKVLFLLREQLAVAYNVNRDQKKSKSIAGKEFMPLAMDRRQRNKRKKPKRVDVNALKSGVVLLGSVQIITENGDES